MSTQSVLGTDYRRIEIPEEQEVLREGLSSFFQKNWEVKNIGTLSLMSMVLRKHEFNKIPDSQKGRFHNAIAKILSHTKALDQFHELGEDISVQFKLGDEDSLYMRVNKDHKWIRLAQLQDVVHKKNSPIYEFFRELRRIHEFGDAFFLGERTDFLSSDHQVVQKKYESVVERFIHRDRLGSMASIFFLPRAAGDVDGVVRNVLSMVKSVGPKSPLVTVLGASTGALALISGAIIANKGYQDRKEAEAVEDREGVIHSRLYESIGWSLTGVGSAFLVSKSAEIAKNQAISSAAGLPILPAYGLVCLLAGIYGINGIRQCSNFRDKMDEYFRQSDLDEKTKYKGVLQFLKNRLMPSDSKCKRLRAEIEKEHPDKTEEEKKTVFEEKLDLYMQKRRLKLIRRTSTECAKRVAENVDRIIREIDDPEYAEEALLEAKVLVAEVYKENFKKLVLYSLIIVVAISGISAVIASFLISGPLPLILMALTSALWLTVDTPLSDYIGDALWTRWWMLDEFRKIRLLETQP